MALLVETQDLVAAGERILWNAEGYPAHQVSLRSASNDSVVIQTAREGRSSVIGEIDRAGAPLLVHAGAIYLHEGRSYRVESMDLDEGVATVLPVDVDYYSEVVSRTEIEVFAEHDTRLTTSTRVGYGDLLVTSQITGFRRVKRFHP